ncbi:MAG: S9 family peptidase [Bdellovibrionia bacterium]
MTTKKLPPMAAKQPQSFRHHGIQRTDKYFWLRDIKDKRTLPHLKAENAYFAQEMKALAPLKNRLFKEMKARIQEEDSSVPAVSGPFEYYYKYKKGQQYLVEYRKPLGSSFKKEEVILDHNALAKGHKYFDCDLTMMSPNHRYAAYAFDVDGSEKYYICIKDLSTGLNLKDKIPNTRGQAVWANDNKTFFYIELNEKLRPYRVKRHVLGDDPSKDRIIYEDNSGEYFLGIHNSSCQNYIFIGSYGSVDTEYLVLSANDPQNKAQLFLKKKSKHEYYLDHHHSLGFIIRSNYHHKDFALYTCDSLKKTQPQNWKKLYVPKSDIQIKDFHVMAHHLVISEQYDGLPQLSVLKIENNKHHVISFPDEAYHVTLSHENYEYFTEEIRLQYSSPIRPETTYSYNVENKELKTLKVKHIKGHNPKDYVCKRVWVKSHDQVKVPLVIVYNKKTKLNASAPGYLYGYGSYGAIIPDAFPARRDIFRMVDRGMVYAMAHIRGGAEMGQHWHEDGKFLKKKNTFLDFIACAEYLKKNSFVASSKLAISGGSAGGMLVGACANMRPDLFDLVVAHVPFVDVINTMLDDTLPLTKLEYNEWGNPADKKYFKYMLSYSPYDNVEAKDYPPFFVTCGLNDHRVTYWEPAKWVAKLRELKTDNNKILFKINMGAGHFGTTGRFDYLWEYAEEYAFVLNHFGLGKK